MSRERFLTLLSANKFPILLALVGLTFILIGVVTTINKGSNEKGVILEEAASTSASIASGEELIVDVSGSVLHPGVYSLNADARIQDALIKAGGLAENADRNYISKNINLAAKVSDGAKIYIPKIGESASVNKNTGGTSSFAGVVSGLININTATAAELDPLPGIGPKTAQKIIDGRPYGNIEELLNKKIVGSKVFGDIKDKISAY